MATKKIGIDITGNASGGIKAAKSAEAALDQFGNSADRVSKRTGSAFESMKSKMFSVQGAIAALTTGAFAAMVKQTIDAADETQKLSIRLGASTEALSEYRHVAELTGVTFDSLTTAWQRQTRRISEAAAGTGAAKKALDELGLSASNLAKLAPEKQFEVLADAINNVAEESDKVRLAQKLWDSEGVKLLQTVKGGSASLKEMREEARKFGLTLTQENADAMAGFNDGLTRMGSIASGSAKSLTVALLPALDVIMQSFESAAEELLIFLDRMDLVESASKEIRFLSLQEELNSLTKSAKTFSDAIENGFLVNNIPGAMEMVKKSLNEVNEEIRRVNAEIWALDEVTEEVVGTNNKYIESNNDSTKSVAGLRKEITALEKLRLKEISTASKYLKSLIDEQDQLRMTADEYERFQIQKMLTANVSDEVANAILREYNALQQLRDQINEVEAAEKAWNDAQDQMAEEFKRTSESIERSLTDALMRGFESGSTFGENFVDTMENLFKTMVIRPIIQAAVQPIANEITSALGLGAPGGASGGLNLLSSGSSIFRGVSSLFGGGSLAAGTGLLGASSAAAGGSILAAAHATGTLAAAAPLATSGLSAVTAGLGSFTGALSAALPVLGLGLGAASVLGLFGGDVPDPRYRSEGGFGNVSVTNMQDEDEVPGYENLVNEQVATLNLFEQNFMAMLSESQQEAVGQVEFPAMVIGDTEDELAGSMINRLFLASEALDEEMRNAYADAWAELSSRKGPGEWTLGDVQTIIDEYLRPVLFAQQLSEQLGEQITTAEGRDIAEAAGGLDSFLQSFAIFTENFITEAEKFELLRDEVKLTLEDIGLGSIPRTREAFADLVNGLDRTTEAGRQMYGELIAISPAMDAFYNAMEPLTDLMSSVDDEIADITLSPFQNELRDIQIWLDEATASATNYGASQQELARIQYLASLRVAEAIAAIEGQINDLVAQLYGGSSSANLALIEDQIRTERDFLQDQNDAARELYNTEMARYRASLQAIDRIGDYLAGLAQGSLSVLTPLEKLNAATAEYESTLLAAQGGDADALNDITTMANALLEASRAYFASSDQYTTDFETVNADLIALAQTLGLITEPVDPGTDVTSVLLQELEAQRLLLIEQAETEDRAALALELATKIGELGLATGTDVFALLTQFGVDIAQLAVDFGLDISTLDASLIDGLLALGSALGTDLVTLGNELGIDSNALGNLIADQFVGLPADIALDLDPALAALRLVSDNAALQSAMQTLNQMIWALPENQRAKLDPRLLQIAMASESTGDDVKSQISYVASTSANTESMSLVLGHPTAGLAQIANTYQWNLLRNARSLNQGLGYPSYETGISEIPQDMMANVHKGEMIIDPQSAEILREYGIGIRASNDENYRPINAESANASMTREIRSLKDEVVQLREDIADLHDKDTRQRAQIGGMTINTIKEAGKSGRRGLTNTSKVA